jgi:4-hydroxybenzoate polyprenyltransferase
VLVTAVSAALAAGLRLPPRRAALYTTSVLAGQLSIGWSNDALDAERDAATRRSDKPAARGEIDRRQLWTSAGVAALASTATAVPLGAGATQLMLPAAGWAYNLGLKGTWWSAAAYAVGFAALPASAWLARRDRPPLWAPAGAALLAVAAHVANVLPDLADDAATGVQGLPHRLGRRRATALMLGCAAAGAVLLGSGTLRKCPPARRPSWTA